MKEIKPRIKPIIPSAPTPPAEELERSYQEAMRRISGETAPELVVEPEKTSTKKSKTPAKPAVKGRPKKRPKTRNWSTQWRKPARQAPPHT